MKIFSAKQTQALDQYTIEHEPITSLDLMERASRGVFNWLCNYFPPKTSFTVFCGTGNNGGDGLAVARLLYKHGYKTTCYLINSERYSEDNQINQERLEGLLEIKLISAQEDIKTIETDVIIDALFGSGLNKPASGIYGETIDIINKSDVCTVAIDIASGLYCDQHSSVESSIIKPEITLSFEHPKLAFLLPENESFVGDWQLIDICLHEEGKNKTSSSYLYTTCSDKKSKRRKFSHKGTYGHALLISGSYGKMGAALLASRACLRAGVGLLTTHIPKCGYEIVQIGLPEAMVSIDSDEAYFSKPPKLERFKAIGIGPGIGTDPKSVHGLKSLLNHITEPLVIDADGINILAENKALLNDLPDETILTPHPKEFERLVGTWDNDYEKLELLKKFCSKYNVIITLKGAHTAICTPNGVIHFNSTGNPGMATAGSGDVLTGIILAYLAQGMEPLKAAIQGVYNHGLAGDKAVESRNNHNIIAGDIINCI